MSTSKPYAEPRDGGARAFPPLAYSDRLFALYADMLGTTFGIMHEMAVEATTVLQRAVDLWLVSGVQSAGPSAEPAATPPAAEAADDDDGPCCGAACTSKACGRVFKALELAVSDLPEQRQPEA